ncbi:MAG: hypothetical protein IJU55_01700 [Selenomonadaceae bacterium]|nr:hypothetical protein [Selenomonadaceae bacterium]
MDELNDLEEILSAAKEIGEKLQAKKKILTEEILRLRAENEKILSERNNLLVELNSLLVENEKLRKINESFGEHLRQINDLSGMFIRGDFQKFLTDSDCGESSIVPSESEVEILNAEENQPKKKMLYADFYAEEIGFKED